jgi:hypothetical protein
MALSKTWNMTDNAYFQSRSNVVAENPFNNGVMGIFETIHDGKVNKCIAEYAKSHDRRDTLLFNNRLYFGIMNPKQVNKDQYEANRTYILKLFTE